MVTRFAKLLLEFACTRISGGASPPTKVSGGGGALLGAVMRTGHKRHGCLKDKHATSGLDLMPARLWQIRTQSSNNSWPIFARRKRRKLISYKERMMQTAKLISKLFDSRTWESLLWNTQFQNILIEAAHAMCATSTE